MRWIAMLALVLVSVKGNADEPTAEEAKALAEEAKRLAQEGRILEGEGRYPEALDRLRRSLAINERLYPKAQYPDGHRDLAAGLHNLGLLLRAMGRLEPALPYAEEAL